MLFQKEINYEYLYGAINEIEDHAIILLDTEGNIRNWNRGAEKIKGYTSREVIGKNIKIFYTEKDQLGRRPQEVIELAIAAGRATEEGFRVRKDGSTFWASSTITAVHDEEGRITGFIKITRDLTELNQLVSRLDTLDRAINEIEGYAIILLDTQGNIVNWNRGAEKIKGYRAEEITGENFRKFYTQDDLLEGKPDRLIALAANDGWAQDEGWRKRKDGSVFWASVTISAVHDGNGKLVGFSKVTRDLTERRKTEIERESHYKKMETKNMELEQFAYIASHDLQEPLRSITTLAKMLARNYGEDFDEQGRKMISFIEAASDRMRDLVSGLLDYSRLGINRKATRIDCSRLIDIVKQDIAQRITDTKTSLVVDQLPELNGFEVELRLLFQNLISNAMKFVKEGVDPVVYISSQESPDYWKFCVSDNGIGIQPEFREKIFTIFQQLNPRHKYDGTGIGLAHARKIVEMHNGKIWVEPNENGGSRFFFTVHKRNLL